MNINKQIEITNQKNMIIIRQISMKHPKNNQKITTIQNNKIKILKIINI